MKLRLISAIDSALGAPSIVPSNSFKDAVWGNQTIFKNTFSGGEGSAPPMEYLDFGEFLTAIKVIAPTVRAPQFLVREEYRQAMETFERDEDYSGGACIMGQPGIGKSCFIAYGVIEMLRREQPVAVQVLPEGYDESYALFSEDGVTLHPGHAPEPLRHHKGIWAFSDSNADVNIPAIAFRTTPDVRVFQTTSPKIQRWKEWTKQNIINRYIMNVWSREEIATLATLSQLDVDRMIELAFRWGPAPRTLLQIFKAEQESLFEPLIRSIAFEAIPKCRNILRSMASLDAPVDPGPSSIFFIRPEKIRDGSRVPHEIYIPTETITKILGAAVCAAAEGDRHDFFNAMIGSPGTRAAAGFIFETWIHSFLSNGNTTLECHWHAKQSKSRPPILPSASQIAYTDSELRLMIPRFYWRASSNFPGIDSALFCEEDVLYAIQITTSSNHKNPQPGLDKLRDKLGEEKAKKLRWRVLFIGHRAELSEAVSKDFVGQLHMDMGSGGLLPKKPKPIPVGWCTTSPLRSELTVLETLTKWTPSGSVDE